MCFHTLPVVGSSVGPRAHLYLMGFIVSSYPLKTSWAFSQFPDGSPIIVFPYVFNGVGVPPRGPQAKNDNGRVCARAFSFSDG